MMPSKKVYKNVKIYPRYDAETVIDTDKVKYLIIVESPSKCKKIEQILGSEYKCIATKGHIYTITFL